MTTTENRQDRYRGNDVSYFWFQYVRSILGSNCMIQGDPSSIHIFSWAQTFMDMTEECEEGDEKKTIQNSNKPIR